MHQSRAGLRLASGARARVVRTDADEPPRSRGGAAVLSSQWCWRIASGDAPALAPSEPTRTSHLAAAAAPPSSRRSGSRAAVSSRVARPQPRRTKKLARFCGRARGRRGPLRVAAAAPPRPSCVCGGHREGFRAVCRIVAINAIAAWFGPASGFAMSGSASPREATRGLADSGSGLTVPRCDASLRLILRLCFGARASSFLRRRLPRCVQGSCAAQWEVGCSVAGRG